MPEHFKIAVIGAGPAGMSAAAHAAELGETHVLLEASPLHADTIQKYQKGKHVMAEPGILPLRSPLEFDAGARETILSAWEAGLNHHNTHVWFNAQVSIIQGTQGAFAITCADGRELTADNIILGIGLQGNLRKLGVPGADEQPWVQYQLDDPDEYTDETIIIVGAGDAAIENAMALSSHNKVIIINRRDEFARAKQGNLDLINNAIESGKIQCYFSSSPTSVAATQDGEHHSEHRGELILKTVDGEAHVPCDRIIARLGAIPPRKLVESFGIEFPNGDPKAIPELTAQYESNVPGLYIIGALGGYPLIKQAMNQGYEVVEYILGNDIDPADQPLLADRFLPLPYGLDVDDTLELIQQRIRCFSGVNTLQLRELMLESNFYNLAAGDTVFEKNDYTNTFYTVLDGSVDVILNPKQADSPRFTINQGEFFGEMSLISGRRRSATVVANDGAVLIETPRRSMVKLINSVDSVKRTLDETFILRTIQTRFAPNANLADLRPIASQAQLNQYHANDVLFNEGDTADTLHLIRSGSVRIAKQVGDREITMAYVAANNYIGEIGLLGGVERTATVTANVATETVSLDRDSFHNLLAANPELRADVQAKISERLADNARMEADPGRGDVISFLMRQGIGEATDVLLIDESLCVRCDNCETACAETHQGTSRLDREAGPTFANVHVPTSCRHCEDPHCMKDCPPDAIHRAPNGEVFIDDSCIGCGNCERNCPYDVIHMAAKAPKKPGLLSWLLFGLGSGPGEEPNYKDKLPKDAAKKAVKCDMCKDLGGGPACVRACPTGAAIRVSPEGFTDLLRGDST